MLGAVVGAVGSLPPTNSGSTPLLVSVTVEVTAVPIGLLPNGRLVGSTPTPGPLITLPRTVKRSVLAVLTPGPPMLGPSTLKKFVPVGLPVILCRVALSPT